MLTTIHGKREISVQYVIVLVYKPTYIICHCACIVFQPAIEDCKKMPFKKEVLKKVENMVLI
jgi:hypothetical protein